MHLDTGAPADPSDRAIVVGGSIAGLLAARVLLDHFAEVVLVERDHFPEGAEFRKGVPQSRHVHVLLARGAQVLEQLFPHFADDLTQAGAATFQVPSETLWLAPAGWGTRFERGLRVISCRREFLESAIRQRVFRSERLRVVQDHDVTGLVAAEHDRSRVTGVHLHGRFDGATVTLEGRLVVDASGRNSRLPEWLQALGYDPPQQTVINSFLGYASRQYASPDGFRADWRALNLQANAPTGTRAGVLVPIDGGHWQVTLAGMARDYPPTDPDGFLEFARTLRSPVLYQAIKRARPLTDVAGYRRTENQLRHYHRLRRWPEQLVVLGDAVCGFNPVYGQGMTVAGETSLLLDRWLTDSSPAHAFQQRLAKLIRTPWLLATGEDFRYPSTEGGRPAPGTRLLHRYFDRVLTQATVDEVVLTQFIRVLHLLEPPTVLFSPRILARVLRGPTRPLLSAPPTATFLADVSPDEVPVQA